jgi:coronin-1B/1C/6
MPPKKIVRESKFRQIYGQTLHAPANFENVKVTKLSVEGTFCSVNPRYLAIATEVNGGRSFLVLPVEATGRVDWKTPQVVGHSSPVCELAWSPHNDSVIASACEDGGIKIWVIPDGGLVEPMIEASRELSAHKKRVTSIIWHPSVYLVLLSAGMDSKLVVWDVSAQTILREIAGHGDSIYSAAWNRNGSLIATTCKDKVLRVFDPRTGDLVHEQSSHQGSKNSRVIFLRDGNLLTLGSSKIAGREFALYSGADLKLIYSQHIDQGNNSLIPLYDEDTNLFYTCARGDAMITFWEYTPDEAPFIHMLSFYMCADSQRSICVMPKRGINIAQTELIRLEFNPIQVPLLFCEFPRFRLSFPNL